MSPRAAWQLERMGFGEVYDFVGGKIEWILNRLPLEGNGPHYFIAGEIVDRDVATCRPEDSIAQAFDLMERAGDDFCLATNEEGILLGRLRAKKVTEDERATVGELMEPGPATVRTVEPLKPLVERMERAGVKIIVVTDEKGHLVGVVRREAAEEALKGDGPLRGKTDGDTVGDHGGGAPDRI